jgi:hypothetical protein
MVERTVETAKADAETCSLPGTEMLERIARWKRIAKLALSRTAEPGVVRSTYARTEHVASELRDLIDAEAQCCSFLSFSIRERGDVLEMELQYPAEFEPMLALIVPDAALEGS